MLKWSKSASEYFPLAEVRNVGRWGKVSDLDAKLYLLYLLQGGLGKNHNLPLKFLSSPADPQVLQLTVSSSFKQFFFNISFSSNSMGTHIDSLEEGSTFCLVPYSKSSPLLTKQINYVQ